MRLSLLNKDKDDKVIEPEEETALDELGDEVQHDVDVADAGRICNYTRKGTWGYDDIRGGN